MTGGDVEAASLVRGEAGLMWRSEERRVGGYKLKCYSLAAHIILEARWIFIVKHLGLGAKAPIGELGMEDGVGSDELCFTPRFYRLGDDCVAFMVVVEHEVLAATTGGDGEAASLVS